MWAIKREQKDGAIKHYDLHFTYHNQIVDNNYKISMETT